MSEYTKQAEGFLRSHGLKFRAVLLGCEVNTAWADDLYHGTLPRNKYRCTVSGKGRGRVSFTFWQSIQGTADGETPDAYSLFSCITKYDPETFENFCSEYGYNVDSRKALRMFQAVVREWTKVQRFFTADEIEELQEIS